LFQLDACVLCFEHLKSLYADDEDLAKLYFERQKHPKGDLFVQEGFLFKGTWLCIPKCSTRELMIREVHGGSLAGHFRESKTLILLREHYYWPGMEKEVQDILWRCRTCQASKSHILLHDLYTPLQVPTLPWIDVSMDFILGLPKTQRNKDSIFVVVNGFSKMAHFIPCNRTNDVEVSRLYIILKSIISDSDTKF